MILIIQRELTSRGWIKEEDFADLIAMSQAAPGLLAVNISIFTGFRLRGIPGAVTATIGSCIAPFLIVLSIALFFSDFANAEPVRRVFSGMRPAVVALIAVPMLRMLKNACKEWWHWLLAASAMILVAVLRLSPVYLLCTVIAVSLALSFIPHKKKEGEK